MPTKQKAKEGKRRPCSKVRKMNHSQSQEKEHGQVRKKFIGVKKERKKEVFLQDIDFFYFIQIKTYGQNNYFLAFTRTNMATPAIIPPNTNSTKIGNPPEEVSSPWGATVDVNANSVSPIF